MVTRDDIKRFAPRARPEYIDAFMAGVETLRAAGVLDNERRLCHFMAQVGHETGGLTIIREGLNYSAKRMREVWPSRFRSKSDAELKPLVKNGLALGDVVYGGRMGNRDAGDGFHYRGGGWIQTTGRGAVEKYAANLGIKPKPELLDDLGVTLKFACLEWQESGCNDWADENDLTKVCKAINTGSATSNVKPVGMADRQAWFAKAWSIWGDKGSPDVPIGKSVPVAVSVSGGAIGATGGTLAVSALLSDPVGLSTAAVAIKNNSTQLLAGVNLTTWGVPIAVLLIVACVVVYARRQA